MKLTKKAVFLVFLCLFATLAVPVAVCLISGLTLKGTSASNVHSPKYEPLGDPVDTPGGGGRCK